MIFNKYQTDISYLINEEPKVYSMLMEAVNTIPFMRHIMLPDTVRGYAKDRPRDPDTGKIKVDIVRPHIIEDMDFFRERALFFEKHGKYTNIYPSKNPFSDYAKFWREEKRRFEKGLVRESDGEWIPGYLYFYWNYSPIWQMQVTGKVDKKTGKAKGKRISAFPLPYLGDYLFFHYVDQAREAGQHVKMLKSRGIGMAGPNSEKIITPEGVKTYGDIKEGDYLIDRTGAPTKVKEVYPQGELDIYEVVLTDGRTARCTLNHLWDVIYKNKRSVLSLEELLKKKLSIYHEKASYRTYYYALPKIQPVQYKKKDYVIPPYTLGVLIGDGSMLRGETKISSIDKDIIDKVESELDLAKVYIKKATNDSHYYLINKVKTTNENYITREVKRLELDKKTISKFIPTEYLLGSVEQRMDLLRGLMDTDGTVNNNGSISFSTISEELKENFLDLVYSLGIKATASKINQHLREDACSKYPIWRIQLSTTNSSIFSLSRKKDRVTLKKFAHSTVYIKEIKKLEYKEESTCFLVDNPEHLYLTSRYIPTHNSFKAGALGPCNMLIYPGSGNPNFYLASDKTFLGGDKGVFGKVVDTLDWLAINTPFPKMRLINSIRSMEIQLGYMDDQGNRKGALSSVYGISLKDNPDKARGIRGPMIFYEEDGLFPHLEKAWNVNRPGMEAGNVATGLMFSGGTGGVEGSSFEGSKKLFYSPAAYNIYGVPNFYDKNSQGISTCGFFWGAYLNREGCTNEGGEPDITKALVEILTERVHIISASNDPASITQKKAEHPLTPEEAIMRTKGNMFPVSDISEYLLTIDANKDKFLSSHYVGKLVYTNDGGVKWLPDPEEYPIRTLDTTGSNKRGAVEIFEMPKYTNNNEVQSGRYIAGIDPIDQDEGDSLFVVTVMDLFVDRLVAQYIGRYPRAEECYEVALKLLIMYNAKANYENNLKGLYSYFKFKNALHYLADTPEVLKDMDFMKPSANASKGTRATAPVNAWGRQLQVSWMLTPVKSVDDENAEEENIENNILNLHKVRSLRYLEEALVWNQDGNYDTVSAMGMLFIYREELLRQITTMKTETYQESNTWSDSDFWDSAGKVRRNLEKMKLKFGDS